MAEMPQAGNHVAWNTPQGNTFGTVKKKLTRPIEIKGHHVAASAEHPELLVETDKTHQEAAHLAEELTKVKGK